MAGVIALASLVVYGQSNLVVGGSDDGISLLALLPWLDSFDLVGLNLIRYYQLQGRAWKHVFHPADIAFSQSDFRRWPASDGWRGFALGHVRAEVDYISEPEGAYLAQVLSTDRRAERG